MKLVELGQIVRLQVQRVDDGTVLSWTGAALQIERNSRARTIELRLPDGSNVQKLVDPGPSTIAV